MSTAFLLFAACAPAFMPGMPPMRTMTVSAVTSTPFARQRPHDRPAVLGVQEARAPAPVAFESGAHLDLESLSKNELVEILQKITSDLSPAEAERVNVVERVSPSVAHIQTLVV